MAAAGLCGEWCGESTRPVRAPSAAAGLGTCTCQRAQREAKGREEAVCGVGGVSDSGDQPAALQVVWSTDAVGGTLALWWARRARGAGRAGARQGRRCLAAVGLTSAPRQPAPTHGRQECFQATWMADAATCVGSSAAARTASAAMPSTPARADTPLVMAWWPRDLGGCAPCQAGGMALGGGPVGAGGRGWPPDPAQPTPASRRHAARAPPRHGSWTSCTPCPVAGRAGGAGLEDSNSGWQALAGGRRA